MKESELRILLELLDKAPPENYETYLKLAKRRPNVVKKNGLIQRVKIYIKDKLPNWAIRLVRKSPLMKYI